MANENRNPGQQGGQSQRGQQHAEHDQRRDQQQRGTPGKQQDEQRHRKPQPGDPADNRSGEQRQGEHTRRDQQR